MGKAKEIAELGDKITVSGGTVTVADISTSTFSGTSIHSMQDVDLTGIAHNMFLKYNLSNTRFEVVAGNTSSIDEGTNLYYTDARVASYLSSNDFDTATNIVASITDSAPGTLDTLNELAAALGDDANFSTTVTNSIATKLPLSGGTVTGNLTVTGVGGFNDYIDLNTSGNRGKIGYDNLNLYLGSTSGTGEIHFKNNIGSTDAPHSSGDTKMVITDSRVGIKNTGTDISGTSLDDVVIGAGNTVAGIVLDGGGSNDTAYGFASGGTKVGRIQYINSSNSMVFQTNNANQMTIDDSGNLDVNGNISISNATSPPNVPTTYEQLYLGDLSQIYNRTSLGLSISTNNEFGGSPIHKYQANGTAGLIEMFGNSFKYYNAPTGNAGQTPSWTNRFTINASGNVGIGTATPGRPLHVQGEIYVNHNADNAGVKTSFRALHTSNNTIEIHQFGQSHSNGAVNQIGVSNAEQHLHLVTDSSANVDAGTSTKGIFLRSGGNVGIGTTNPVQKLQVAGNAFIGANGTPVNNSLYASNLDFLQVGKGIIFQAGTDSQGFFKSNHYWNGSGHGFLDTSHGSTTIRFNENNDGILQFETAPSGGVSTTPRLTIRNNGNVGINQSNPQKRLEVWTGNAELSHFGSNINSSGQYTGITLGYAESGNANYRKVGIVAAGYGDGAARQNLHFLLDNNADGGSADLSDSKMMITSSGLVGIGNSDPTDKLTMTVGNGGGILQSTYYSGTATSGQKLGVIGFKGYSQGNTVAGADAKIEAVAAGNHSGSSAPANLDFYTKPESIGPGSAAILRHRIHEEGHQTIYKGTNNWSVQRHNQSSGCFVCHRLYGASSSTTTYNLLRYRRHYWGSGSVKFTLSQTYYSGTAEGEYWLTGHGRSDGSYNPSYSIAYVDVYNGPGSGRLSTNMPGGAPGTSAAEIVDVSISIPAYYYYMVRIEVSHSEYYTTTGVMGSVNSFALFT